MFGLAQDFATSFVVEEEAFCASFSALISDAGAYLAVAEAEGSVIGYVLAFRHSTLYANGRAAWIEEIMVAANCRRQGIGKALMQSAETWAADEGCRLIALATRRAADFYEAQGYQVSAAYYRKLV